MTTAPLHALAHCLTRTRTLAPLVIFAFFSLSCTEQPPEKPALPKLEQCEHAWKSSVSYFGGSNGRCRGAWGYNGILYFVTQSGKLVSRPKLSPFLEHQSQVWSIHPEG